MEWLELYRWFIPVSGPLQPVARLREMERLVRDRIAPTLRDADVHQRIAGCHLWKRDTEEGASSGATGVGVDFFATPEADAPLTAAVSRHFEGLGAVGGRGVEDEAAVILYPVAAEYRRGLTEVSEVALDLHAAPEPAFRAHQCALIEAACSAADPRYRLQSYLAQHSPAYVRLARPEPTDEGGLGSWEQEGFWSRLYTPGPGRGLRAPIYSLWNIVLGTAPRRWSDRRELAARLGIECD